MSLEYVNTNNRRNSIGEIIKTGDDRWEYDFVEFIAHLKELCPNISLSHSSLTVYDYVLNMPKDNANPPAMDNTFYIYSKDIDISNELPDYGDDSTYYRNKEHYEAITLTALRNRATLYGLKGFRLGKFYCPTSPLSRWRVTNAFYYFDNNGVLDMKPLIKQLKTAITYANAFLAYRKSELIINKQREIQRIKANEEFVKFRDNEISNLEILSAHFNLKRNKGDEIRLWGNYGRGCSYAIKLNDLSKIQLLNILASFDLTNNLTVSATS